MSEKRGSFGTLTLGILIGGLVGASVALLSAPMSGIQTRAAIRDKSLELKNRASEQYQQIQMRANDTMTKVRTRAEEVAHRIQNRTNNETAEKSEKMREQMA